MTIFVKLIFFRQEIISSMLNCAGKKLFKAPWPDVQHSLVKKAMPRNRFRLIVQNLNFCENDSIDADGKCGKDAKSLQFSLRLSTLMRLSTYYGKFRQKLKQMMPMKLIRSDYKVLCLNLEGGYLYNF